MTRRRQRFTFRPSGPVRSRTSSTRIRRRPRERTAKPAKSISTPRSNSAVTGQRSARCSSGIPARLKTFVPVTSQSTSNGSTSLTTRPIAFASKSDKFTPESFNGTSANTAAAFCRRRSTCRRWHSGSRSGERGRFISTVDGHRDACPVRWACSTASAWARRAARNETTSSRFSATGSRRPA